MIRVGILTVSDKGSVGKREDKSGNTIKEMVGKLKAKVVIYEIIPDEKEEIKKTVSPCPFINAKPATKPK